MKGTVKKNWSIDQKVKFVEGLANWNGSKKDYCKKYGLNADVVRRWEIAYKNGTLVASGKKPVAKAKSVKFSTTKPKVKAKSARSVVKSSVKTKKSFFGWFGNKTTKTSQSKAFIKMSQKCDDLARQLKASKAEASKLRKQLAQAKKSA